MRRRLLALLALSRLPFGPYICVLVGRGGLLSPDFVSPRARVARAALLDTKPTERKDQRFPAPEEPRQGLKSDSSDLSIHIGHLKAVAFKTDARNHLETRPQSTWEPLQRAVRTSTSTVAPTRRCVGTDGPVASPQSSLLRRRRVPQCRRSLRRSG